MDKVGNVVTKKVKVTFGKNKSTKKVIKAKEGEEFTKANVMGIVKHYVDENRRLGQPMTYMYDLLLGLGYRSSPSFNEDESIPGLDDYDWDTTPEIVIYMLGRSVASGGEDEHNDCLYNAIKKCITYYRFPKLIKTAEQLKRALGLSRDSKVPISLMHKVEDVLKLNINVDGYYVSKGKFKMTVNVTLENDHYELAANNGKEKEMIKQIPLFEQQLIIAEEGDDILCYDGEQEYTLEWDDYAKADLFGKYAYVTNIPNTDIEGIVEKYDYLIAESAKLKELTCGKIDLSKCGYRPINQAMKCLHNALLPFAEAQPLTKSEEDWIYDSFKGGLIFTDNSHIENAYDYDKNSAYPSMMCSSAFSFPINQGKFVHLTEFGDFVKYGIYHAEILKSSNELTNRLFVFNSKNKYTHYDIQCAQKLGLSVRLIQDNEANALLYSEGRLTGSEAFGGVIDQLYKLKKESKLAKAIINCLWGGMCQKKKIKKTTYDGDVVLNDDKVKLISIIPYGDVEKVTYVKRSKLYKHNYARIGTFLTALGRYKLAMDILPNNSHVHRAHTDSILASIPLNLPIGTEIGEWKLVKSGQCQVGACNRPVEWFEED